MEATIALVLVLTLLFGGMFLALVMGYLSAEEAKAARDAKARHADAWRIAEPMVAIPGFFKMVDAMPSEATPQAFDEFLLAQLEHHVKAEQAVVKQFVHLPSVDSLYRQSGSPLNTH
jgi:hypothetical protein